MPLDTSQNNQKVKISAGEVIVQEGSPCRSIILLHEGTVSFEKQIQDYNIVIYSVAGTNLTLGSPALINHTHFPYTIRARSSCLLSTYPMNPSNALKTLGTKPSLGMMVARSILKEISEAYKKNNQILKLKSKVESYTDNLSVLYYQCTPSSFPDIDTNKPIPLPETYSDPVMKLIRENLKNFIERGGILPDKPNVWFLNENHSEFFMKIYQEEQELDDKEFHFIRKILVVNPKIVTALFESDPSLLVYVNEKLSETYKDLLDDLSELIGETFTIYENLLGASHSLVDKYLILADLLDTGYSPLPPQILIPILDNILEKSNGLIEEFQVSFATPYRPTSDGLQKLKQKNQLLQQKFAQDLNRVQPTTTKTTTVGVNIEAIKKELVNSPSQIFNYASTHPDQVKEFSALMIKLKSLKNPLDSESDVRKIRRGITKIYWDIYKACFVKNLESGNTAPLPVKLMLMFGFFDETLLDEDQYAFLASNLNPSPTYREELPVHYGPEWLELIYNKKVPPSIDELGQTFFERIKNDLRDPNIKKESDLPPSIDTSEARLNNEMVAMYEPNVRLTSGSIANHFPILTRYHITIPLDKCLVTKEKVFEAIKEILEIDYTAFTREVIYNNEQLGIRSEFVNKSVLPDMIIVPSIGTKVMMWQDLSILRGTGSKESRGRFVIPIFVTGDFKTMLMEAVAVFRWELCKNIKGPDWNNVSQPSITADYTDYVQFFKKNKDLSLEIKEKLATEFKRFRNDRDKFVNDYLIWMKYESQGNQRLNKVVRNIFYRHIPFHKKIRDQLSTQPAFIEIHNRFKNIRNRQYRELENRYKKYMNDAGSLPDVLQENLNYYLV